MKLRHGFSFLEIVVAILVIGMSAAMIIELIRSSTVSVEVTEAEAAARVLATDVMNRIASRPVPLGLPPGGGAPAVGPGGVPVSPGIPGDPLLVDAAGKPTQIVGAKVPYRILFNSDATLAYAFPHKEIAPILDRLEAMVKIERESPWLGKSTPDSVQPYPDLHPDLYASPVSAATTGVDFYRVTVSFKDRNDQPKEVAVARILARQ